MDTVFSPGQRTDRVPRRLDLLRYLLLAGAVLLTASYADSGLAQTTSCKTGQGVWQNTPVALQSGIFTAEFDATPNAAFMNGVVGLSSGPAGGYSSLAAIVRFDDDSGHIDARNGGTYTSDTAVPYTVGTTYHFRLVINVPAHTYTIYVTPDGSTEKILGTNYLFRTEQSAVGSLDNWALYAGAGSHQVCNFTVDGSPVVANADSVSTDQDVARIIDVLANDIDADPGDTLTVSSITQPANGSVVNNIIDVTYTPNTGFLGTDTFAYTATDGTAASNSATVTVTVTTGSPPPPPSGPTPGIWISRDEIMQLPTSGNAWNDLLAVANTSLPEITWRSGSPARNGGNVIMLAKAYVYARTGTSSYRDDVVAGLDELYASWVADGENDSLGLARTLKTYCVAAELVGLTGTSASNFETMLIDILDGNYRYGGPQTQTVTTKARERPNNHGGHAMASRLAAAIYLTDRGIDRQSDIDETVNIFKGYVGDRSAWSDQTPGGFIYGDLSWQADPANPVGINPVGATISGENVNGVQPDDQRRAGGFSWPPPTTGYQWEGLQGLHETAEIIFRLGTYGNPWLYSDSALRRAVEWNGGPGGFPAEGDDRYLMPLHDKRYGTSYWNGTNSIQSGKGMGFTDWTHSQ